MANRAILCLACGASSAAGLSLAGEYPTQVQGQAQAQSREAFMRYKLPEKVFADKECIDNVREGVPVVALLGNKGSNFYRLSASAFLQELLSDAASETGLQMCEAGSWKASVFAPALLEHCVTQKCGFIFSSNSFGFDQLQQVISLSIKKPDLLIHIGDEGGGQYPMKWYPKMLNEDGLVVRQYSHGYQLPEVPRTIVAPLGYDRMVDPSTQSCRTLEASVQAAKASKRPYHWAYLRSGDSVAASEVEMMLHLIEGRVDPIAPDPTQAIGQLKSAMREPENMKRYHVDLSKDFKSGRMLSKYQQAMFAPVVRVKGNLESNKLYEALLSGAIPVIVAQPSEIEMAFKHHHDPPFITAPTWKQAREKMSALIMDPTALDSLQERQSLWWCGWTASLRHEIAQQLKTRTAAKLAVPADLMEEPAVEGLDEAVADDVADSPTRQAHEKRAPVIDTD